MTGRERRHLRSVPAPDDADGEGPEAMQQEDPEPPDEELRVLLW